MPPSQIGSKSANLFVYDTTAKKWTAVTTTELFTPSSIGNGSKVVETAGTAVPLAASTACRKVIITAKQANAGVIWVGGVDIESGVGKPLVPLQDIEILVDDLAKIYIDASQNGDGVTYIYFG